MNLNLFRPTVAVCWLIDFVFTAVRLRPLPCKYHFRRCAGSERPKLGPAACSPTRIEWRCATYPDHGCLWCGRYFTPVE